jgi:hypothetical protein
MKKITLGLSIFLLTLAVLGATTVSVKTASYAVTLSDDGSIIIFNSASNLTCYLPSLPADRVGFTFTVQKRGAGNVTIVPQALGYIVDSGIGQYLRNTVAGSTWASVTLIYATANHWTASAALGTWATDTSTLGTGLTVPVSVANGGTGAATFALNGILYGNGTAALGVTAIGAEGQVLRAGATPFVPAWTTATYPATASTAGKALIADGTNWTAADILSAVPTGLTYTTATRAVSLTAGYVIPTTTEETKWNLPSLYTSADAALAADGVLTTTIPNGLMGIVMVKEATALNQYFMVTPTAIGTAMTTNAAYSDTKDNALTVNVYIEAGFVKVQNKTASAINIKVGFVGFN